MRRPRPLFRRPQPIPDPEAPEDKPSADGLERVAVMQSQQPRIQLPLEPDTLVDADRMFAGMLNEARVEYRAGVHVFTTGTLTLELEYIHNDDVRMLMDMFERRESFRTQYLGLEWVLRQVEQTPNYAELNVFGSMSPERRLINMRYTLTFDLETLTF